MGKVAAESTTQSQSVDPVNDDYIPLPLNERKKAIHWQGRTQAKKIERARKQAQKERSRRKNDRSDVAELEALERARDDRRRQKQHEKRVKKLKKARDKAARKAFKEGLPPPPSLAEMLAAKEAEDEAREEPPCSDDEFGPRPMDTGPPYKLSLRCSKRGFGLTLDEDCFISKVAAGSPAANAGIVGGRFKVVEIAGQPVHGTADALKLLQAYFVGMVVDLVLDYPHSSGPK